MIVASASSNLTRWHINDGKMVTRLNTSMGSTARVGDRPVRELRVSSTAIFKKLRCQMNNSNPDTRLSYQKRASSRRTGISQSHRLAGYPPYDLTYVDC